MITIALTKGRILKDTLPLLAAVGIVPTDDPLTSRKLVFGTSQENIRLVVLRGSDVPTYVKRGAADLGITGKDTLMEVGADDIYEWIDLGIAQCRMMTAGFKGSQGKVRLVGFGWPQNTLIAPGPTTLPEGGKWKYLSYTAVWKLLRCLILPMRLSTL